MNGTPIRWRSLVADPGGEIDWTRVKSFVSVVLALSAGLVLTLAMAGAIHPGDHMVLGVTALVLPLTGGKIADGIATRVQSKAILEGTAPGRRESDPPAGPTA